ncbi:MAG: DUF1761 domain-containing protein [Bacteroidetes bacterium]|nr:DUF1761 domain-containing protein [Bacteroidota bacterium]
MKNSWIKAMIITFVTTFLTSFALEAIIVTLEITFWDHAITIAILIGLFVYCGNLLSDYLYSGKPIKLF